MRIKKQTASETRQMVESEIMNFVALGFDNNTNDSAHAPMDLLRGNTASKEWMLKNPGKTYEDYLSFLQKPSLDAAASANEAVRDLRRLEATVSDAEESRKTKELQRDVAEQARQTEDLARKANDTKYHDAEVARKTAFDSQMKEAGDATKEAKRQGEYAREQGDYAKEQGDKMSIFKTISESEYERLLAEGKIDNSVYYCTYEDEL